MAWTCQWSRMPWYGSLLSISRLRASVVPQMSPAQGNPSPPAAWDEKRAREIAQAHSSIAGGLLPALQAIQKEFGLVSRQAIGVLAYEFNLTRAEVYGVATFYHDFRLDHAAGRHVLKLCRGEACQAVGADDLAADAKQILKLDWHKTGADGEWTLEPVFCLGLCASGPSAMLDGEPVGKLSAEKLRALTKKAAT